MTAIYSQQFEGRFGRAGISRLLGDIWVALKTFFQLCAKTRWI